MLIPLRSHFFAVQNSVSKISIVIFQTQTFLFCEKFILQFKTYSYICFRNENVKQIL